MSSTEDSPARPRGLRAAGPDPDPSPLDSDPQDALDELEDKLDATAPGAQTAGRLPAEVNDGTLNGWMERIVDHDERALSTLYDATMPRVYRLVSRVVRQAALADEVVEDIYFQVWRQAARFDPERGRALTWLLGIARSRAIDTLRREARFKGDNLNHDALSELEDPAPAVDDLLDAARGHADLQRALMLLNAQPRQLVAMAFFKGLTHEEIASETALPLGTVKSQIRRAMHTLREILGGAAPPAVAS